MPDFTIDVGFDTRGFNNLDSGVNGRGAGRVDSGTGGDDNGSSLGTGLLAALKASGVIALLMNLKLIVDLLAGIFAVLNLGILLFMKTMYEFFKDPMRGLLNFGLLLINGFIAGLENLANILKPGEDVDFGRFRPDVIGQELDAGTGLLEAIGKGFLTEKQYRFVQFRKSQELEEEAKKAFAAQFEADRARASLAEEYAEFTDATLNPAIAEGGNAFVTFWANFIKEINRLNKKVTGGNLSGAGIAFAQSLQDGPLTPSQTLGASRMQSTTISDRDARAYNYLTGLGR
jgi:hypothetical protein